MWVGIPSKPEGLNRTKAEERQFTLPELRQPSSPSLRRWHSWFSGLQTSPEPPHQPSCISSLRAAHLGLPAWNIPPRGLGQCLEKVQGMFRLILIFYHIILLTPFLFQQHHSCILSSSTTQTDFLNSVERHYCWVNLIYSSCVSFLKSNGY